MVDGAARVTLAEVAAMAGVSVGTASKALNDRGSMRAETRERVRQAADRLGFQIDAVARSLQTGRSYTVGMITTDSIGRFSIPVMLGVEDTLGAGQMSVLLCDARDDRIREQYYLKTLLSRRVDGIIVTGRRTDPRPPLAQRPPVPVVYAFMPSADPGDCSIVPDEAAGARRAVAHLLDTGRRRVAVVSGPERHCSARTRVDAALATVREAGGGGVGSVGGVGTAGRSGGVGTAGTSGGVGTAGGVGTGGGVGGAGAAGAAEAAAVVVGEPLYGEWSEAWGRQAARILLRRDPELDAVFCASDQIARGLVDGLREAGKRVPGQVAVVGFDNWDVMTAAARPQLTSVDMDLEGLGRQAAELLLSAIDGNPRPGVHLHPCRLAIRASTAADELE